MRQIHSRHMSHLEKLVRLIVVWAVLLGSWLATPAVAQDATLTLSQAIDIAIRENIALLKSKEGIKAAEAFVKVRRADFLPVFNSTYQYKRLDHETYVGGIEDGSRDEYSLVNTFSQTLFNGFALVNRYKVAQLNLDIAEISENITRLTVIFETKNAYFDLLKKQKLQDVARNTVDLIAAQQDVTANFYQVGMAPLNDLLKVKVELANAKQDLIVAQNNQEIAESKFNIVLRRPINSPVRIEDELTYQPLENEIDYYLKTAEENRLESKIAELEFDVAEKELAIAKKDYYPELTLEGTYFKRGTEWEANDGPGVLDKDGWYVTATASWNFWEWGRTCYGVKEKKARLRQARLNQDEVLDQIRLEVKEAFLKARESEKNIVTVEKAIEQAKENLRMSEARYREQVATSTDVLDAQNLLARTMTNYFNALYDFKISKAALDRALSLEVTK